MAQLVAHHTGSVGVTGSSPVSSTGLNPGHSRDAVTRVFFIFDCVAWRVCGAFCIKFPARQAHQASSCIISRLATYPVLMTSEVPLPAKLEYAGRRRACKNMPVLI